MFVKAKKRKAPSSKAESQSKKPIKLYTKIPEMSTADKLAEIMRLACLINPTPTDRFYTHNKPTVVVNFFGNVAALDVSIYPTGWDFEVDDSEEYRLQFDDDEDADKIRQVMRRLREIAIELEVEDK